MRGIGALFVALFFGLAVGIAGCGGGDEAGEPCAPTPEGAAQCESAICLAVDCSGTPRHVCAGGGCDPSGSDCGGGVCVSTKQGQSYCLPTNVCTGVSPTQ